MESSPRAVSMIIGPTGRIDQRRPGRPRRHRLCGDRHRRCIEPKQFHDVVGYYNRFDIFRLDVDRTSRNPAAFIEEDIAQAQTPRSAASAQARTPSLQANGGNQRSERSIGLPTE
jgi:aliphatic nitrilase